jgi:hypothetical protein
MPPAGGLNDYWIAVSQMIRQQKAVS